MKLKASVVLLSTLFCTYASAGCVGTVVNGRCMGTYVDHPNVGSNANRNDNSYYQGSSGTRYQYDMNNPTDRNRYSTDLDAQRRDQMNLDPRQSLDRGLGQRGGGIFSND